MTEVLYEAARQYQLYGDDRMGEGSVVNVEYTFEKDGSVIEIPMVLAEEEQKIWLLSTGDVSAAAKQKIGPLPGEQSARKVYVEYEAYSPGKYAGRTVYRVSGDEDRKLFRFRYSYSGIQLRNLCDV